MKFAIGYQVLEGPWGGGNRFVSALANRLSDDGHSVYFDLSEPDLDFVILIDPRPRLSNIPFSAGAILRYLAFKNPRALVIHRINECDERKNTHTMNRRLRRANYCADHTVFVGKWLQKLAVWRDEAPEKASVIHNGADSNVFHARGFTPWNGTGPMRLVTHHWGGNWMKGFDVYSQIDTLLDDAEWRERLAFTYIGNLPKGFSFRNAHYIKPLNGEALANELRSHHGYLTASINEPGGNHQNEGALCGLPMLYRDSGCLPEYLNGFGIMFNGPDSFQMAFSEYVNDYPELVRRMSNYPATSDRCMDTWMKLFDTLDENRVTITASRSLRRSPVTFLLNQLPV